MSLIIRHQPGPSYGGSQFWKIKSVPVLCFVAKLKLNTLIKTKKINNIIFNNDFIAKSFCNKIFLIKTLLGIIKGATPDFRPFLSYQMFWRDDVLIQLFAFNLHHWISWMIPRPSRNWPALTLWAWALGWNFKSCLFEKFWKFQDQK